MVQSLENWQACDRPGLSVLPGSYCYLEPFDWDRHSVGLFAAVCGDGDEALWAYMPAGPFSEPAGLHQLLKTANGELGWQTMIIHASDGGEILGMASYMRIREVHGSAEVGLVTFSKKLQRTRIATEAMYLMARHVMVDLGYRRYEWKCNNANAASKRAAVRFGFQYEGVFRNDMVAKGKNRDTAWYALIDKDWPALESAYQKWLEPVNFSVAGLQLASLESFRAE